MAVSPWVGAIGGVTGIGLANYFGSKGERDKRESDYEAAQRALEDRAALGKFADELGQERLGWMERGEKWGQQKYGTPLYQLGQKQFSPEMLDIISRLKERSYGIKTPELEAMRQREMGPVQQQQTAAQAMAARMAQRSGLRGAAVNAQAQQAARQALAQRQAVDRDIYLQNIAAKDQGLAAYLSGYSALEQEAARRAAAEQENINRARLAFAEFGAADQARAYTQAGQKAEAARLAKEADRKGALAYALDPILGGLFG